MRIRCQKEAEDYKPVRGNEKEIINHLLEHDYYSYWDVEKDGNVISFNIDYKLSFTKYVCFKKMQLNFDRIFMGIFLLKKLKGLLKTLYQ